MFSLEASCLLYMQFQPGIYTSRSDPDLQDMTHALTHALTHDLTHDLTHGVQGCVKAMLLLEYSRIEILRLC